MYEENRLEALLSKASDRPKAASVARVSGGTSGMASTGVGRSAPGGSGNSIDDDGRLSVGKRGGSVGGRLCSEDRRL